MPELPKETKVAIAQFQNYQQQLQSLLIQKETLRLQSLEMDRAMEELNKTDQKTAYKMTGGIMVQRSVEELKKELTERKESVDAQINSLIKMEEKITIKLKELQEKIKGEGSGQY